MKPQAGVQLKQPAEAAVTKAAAPTPCAQPQAAPVPTPMPAETEFAANNHDRIVTAMRSQLLPNGGTMHLRLDPPQLGELQVTIRMIDGVVSAAFETASGEAAKLLSHSLGQLKTCWNRRA